MSSKNRRQRSSLVFAWEAKSTSFLSRAVRLMTPISVGVLAILSTWGLSRVERSRADERQNLADAWHLRQVVDRFRAANDGGCPTSMQQLATEVGAGGLRFDAGASALANFCPADVQTVSFSSYEKGAAPTRAHGPLE